LNAQALTDVQRFQYQHVGDQRYEKLRAGCLRLMSNTLLMLI
jgi:hypothetical protein